MATKKKSSKKVAYKDFEAAKEVTPFMSFMVTEQTIYWSILLVLILGLSFWVLTINNQVNDILSQL